MLTAILSSFNEVHNEVFWANLKLLAEFPDVETLVIDGGSHDGTAEKLSRGQVHVAHDSKRGERYNMGIERAQGKLILLVHPRTRLTREAIDFLTRERWQRKWGAFRHSFDMEHPLLKFTSWYSNHVRGRRCGIFYLDHCLVFSADLKASAHFPSVAVFEDTYFSRSLRAVVRPELLPHTLKTSAVRFRKNGPIRQSVLNQILKILFFFRVSDKWMNRVYEKGLSLNQRR